MQIEIARAAKYGMFGIIAYDKQGYGYILRHQFKCDDPRTMMTLNAIRAKKQIDLRYWRKKPAKGW